jgi:lipid A 3-O-deacylase
MVQLAIETFDQTRRLLATVLRTRPWGRCNMRFCSRMGIFLAWALGMPGFVHASDLAQPAPTIAASPGYSFDRFEIRSGVLSSVHTPENGDVNLNGELVLPKFARLSGWQDILIPRLNVGGMGNVSGGTSYAYAGALWTVNFDSIFLEAFGGGAVHDGPLESPDPLPRNRPSLGCRELYHVGANLGYRFDQNWSAISPSIIYRTEKECSPIAQKTLA